MGDTTSAGTGDAPAPSLNRELIFTVGLAGLACFNDGLTFTAFGSYVSFMSGNVTAVGSTTGVDGELVGAALLALIAFLLGAMLGDYLVDAVNGWGRTTVVLGEALAIVVAAVVTLLGGGKVPLLCILALAMGIQNSALYRHSGMSVAVAGTIARLGRLLGHVLQGEASLSRAAAPALLLVFWTSGASLGGLAAREALNVALWTSVAIALALLVWCVVDRDLQQRPIAHSPIMRDS